MEFRLRDAESVKKDGYVDGETRFSLDVIPGETRVFAVKDKIRPALPAGLVYDFSRSRNSCQEVRTEVNGKPLQARFDGSRLTVEVAKIAPKRNMFLQNGSKVYACVKLSDATASLLQSALRRK